MYNSNKEELIALDISPSSDASSRNRNTQLRKSNKIHSPLVQSPLVIKEKHIVSMFSAKTPSTSNKHKLDEEKSQSLESQTLSDLSDEVFIIEKSETCPSKSDASKSYKEKIKDRFKSVKQQAGMSSKKASSSKSSVQHNIERIRKESTEIDCEITSVRNKFNLGEKGLSNIDVVQFFSSSANETCQEHDVKAEEICAIHRVLPEKLSFNVKVSEKECCFIPQSNPVDIQEKITEDNPRYPEEEGLYINSEPNVAKIHLNIVEQRLASSGEKKWFNCDGTLDIISDPLVDRSIKPILPTETIKNQPPPIIYKPAKPKSEIDCEEVVVVRENILELCLDSVKFTHHPLFSPEHVLKEKLVTLYEKYKRNTESNSLQKIKNHLEALRHVKKNAQLIKNQSGDSSDDKIRMYVKDIKKLREEYLEQSKKYRETLKGIIEVWKTMKKLRDIQKYSTTNVKLLLKKEKVDYLTEKTNYDDFFEDALQEILEESKNNTTNKHKKIKRKDKVRENKSDKSDSTETGITEDSDSENKENKNEDDEKKLAFELRKRFEECLKPPGEPNIKLLLTKDNEITQDVDNPKETTRRQVVATTKFGIKILCNQIDVCKSKLKQLNDDFELEFDEPFSIQLRELPDFLTVELTEYPKGLLKKKIGQVQVTLPSITAASNKFSTENFVKNDVVHYKHAGVGTGVTFNDILRSDDYKFDFKFTALEDIDVELNTAGVLKYSIGWENSGNGALEEKSASDFGVDVGVLDKVIDKNGTVDAVKFTEWMEKCAPDPQDPKNCVFYEYLQWKDSCTVGDSERKCFRLSPHLEPTNFCNISELDKNVRFEILQLRDQHELEFDNTVVPNRIKEIAVNLLNDYRKRKSESRKKEENIGNEEVLNEDDDDFENVRNFGKKQVKQMYLRVFQRCKNSENNLDYDSVVNEKYLTYFEQLTKTLLKNFFNWFRWQPQLTVPLPTTRNLDTNRTIEDNVLKNVEQPKVFVKIISAKCVPSRVKDTFSSDNSENAEENEVCPFVEVSFMDCQSRTTTQTGNNCVWNETLVIPLDHQLTDYLNPNSLIGNISINVFDEHGSESRKTTGNGGAVFNNWIGEVTVPLSAACSSSNLKGMFKVKLPQLLFGYETEWEKQTAANKSPKHDNAYLKSLRQTYLEMEISLTHPVPVLTPNMAELPSNDAPFIKEHVVKWNEAYNASFPNRKFHVVAIDSSGRTNCVTKYIRALEPPQINTDEFDITPDQCARYVSLIPVTDSNQFYSNVWLTSEQLIKYMLGSINDHAVTLTCFLLALKQEAWLLIGFGVPHGSTSYVLVCEYNPETTAPSYSVYEVGTGEKYNLTDPYCPLQRVYCLVNGNNVWGNIQRTDNIVLTRFDLDRRSDWLPLFNDKIESPTNFINTKINYKLLSNVEEIELRLERKIRKKISKLRQLDRTVWNHSVSGVKNLLKIFEINSMYGKSNSDAVTDLRGCLSQYKVNGYLLNIPFTSVSDIIQVIKKTNIHIQEPNVYEFISAVSMHSYPGQVLSVWIYIAVILEHN